MASPGAPSGTRGSSWAGDLLPACLCLWQHTLGAGPDLAGTWTELGVAENPLVLQQQNVAGPTAVEKTR